MVLEVWNLTMLDATHEIESWCIHDRCGRVTLLIELTRVKRAVLSLGQRAFVFRTGKSILYQRIQADLRERITSWLMSDEKEVLFL